MASYEVKDFELEALRGKTVLIVGAATGIGRATVLLAHGHGANVAIGDWKEEEGESLAKSLKERALFRKCDMSNWDDVLGLFETAWATFGQIDVVLANAGIHSEKNWLVDAVRPSHQLVCPDMNTIRVNLDGMIYMTNCAMHYFARRPQAKTQLVFTGSAASFLDTPPLHQYCASKAGVLGLMRSLRSQVPKISHGKTTVNMVAPWQTCTAMTTQKMKEIWGDLPSNSTEGVGKALLLPAIRPDLNGLSFFVHGDQITDLEAGLSATMPQWMGWKLSEEVNEGQRRIFGDATQRQWDF